MLIHSASQILTLSGGPQRGQELGTLNIIPDGAVLIRGDKIAAVGPSEELRLASPGETEMGASGQDILP